MSIFKGSGVAIVTPMNYDFSVNYQKLEQLIEFNIKNSTDAIIVCGTTGEAKTLNDAEHKEVLKFSTEVVNKRIPVIAGTGSNDTAYACDLTRFSCEVGADAMLVVTPYYNNKHHHQPCIPKWIS